MVQSKVVHFLGVGGEGLRGIQAFPAEENLF